MLTNIVQRAANCRADWRMVRWARIVATLIVLIAVLDVVATDAALAAGNVEANPLVRALQVQLGVLWSIPKIAFHTLLAYFVLWMPSRRMLRLGGCVVVGYALILINNFYLAGGVF